MCLSVIAKIVVSMRINEVQISVCVYIIQCWGLGHYKLGLGIVLCVNVGKCYCHHPCWLYAFKIVCVT
jgi:hypothetical protein